MIHTTLDIVSVQGDSLTIDAAALNPTAVDLTSATIYFTAKKSLGDPEVQAFAKQVSTDGSPIIVISNGGVTGTVHIAIPSVVTQGLPYGNMTVLHYDIKVSTGAGLMATIQSGMWTVTPSVTTP